MVAKWRQRQPNPAKPEPNYRRKHISGRNERAEMVIIQEFRRPYRRDRRSAAFLPHGSDANLRTLFQPFKIQNWQIQVFLSYSCLCANQNAPPPNHRVVIEMIGLLMPSSINNHLMRSALAVADKANRHVPAGAWTQSALHRQVTPL